MTDKPSKSKESMPFTLTIPVRLLREAGLMYTTRNPEADVTNSAVVRAALKHYLLSGEAM